MACVCRPRRLPAWCCALSPAPRLGVIILINPNCGTLAREMHGADRGTQLRGVTHTLAPKRACGSSRPAGGGGGACSGLKKEPAPPQGKENSRQSQPRTRVVTSASVSATSAPALTCSGLACLRWPPSRRPPAWHPFPFHVLCCPRARAPHCVTPNLPGGCDERSVIVILGMTVAARTCRGRGRHLTRLTCRCSRRRSEAADNAGRTRTRGN